MPWVRLYGDRIVIRVEVYLIKHDNEQSRSQSMPVRGLCSGMTLHNPRTGILWERDWTTSVFNNLKYDYKRILIRMNNYIIILIRMNNYIKY